MSVDLISNITGLPVDELRVLVVLVSHVIASVIYRTLKVNKKSASYRQQLAARELFGAIVGIISYFYLFLISEMTIIIISSLLFFRLTKYCTTAKATMTINLINFSTLCAVHIHRTIAYYESNICNFNILLMMLVPKQIYFNWYVFNQYKNANEKGDKTKELPSLFNYFTYNFNYIGNLTSPIYSYQEYRDFIEQTYGQTKLDVAALSKKLGLLLGAVVMFVVIGKTHDYNLIDTPLFKDIPYLYQIAYVFIQAFFVRVRYYIIWLISETAVVIVNFRDSDAAYKDYISAIDLSVVETTVSPKKRVPGWNKSIAKFYRLCFYNPFTEYFKINKDHASMLVFILSAFWHGFYPTYYISFFFIYLATLTERIVFKNKDKLWFIPGILYWMFFDMAAIAFKRHTFRSTIQVMKNLWILVILNPGLHIGIRKYLKHVRRKQKTK